MANFDEETLQEFKTEAADMLDEAERHLLGIDKGKPFEPAYNAVFRVFHSIKGGAGMLGLDPIKDHMHKMENHFQSLKGKTSITKGQVDYFLRGVDVTRKLFEGQNLPFNYEEFQTIDATLGQTPSSQRKVPIEQNACYGTAVVVDDEKEIIEILTDFLKQGGFDVRGFTSAKEALEHIPKIKPHVVFSDLSMPEIDGYQFHKQIVSLDPELPVIFVTGHATKEGIINAIKLGIFAVIEKPFSPAQVISAGHSAATRYHTLKLLDRTINLLMYQFNDLDDLLAKAGKEDQRKILKDEILTLKSQRRALLQSVKKNTN